MRGNVVERNLRGRDPVTVEIELNALSSKPLGQLAPANVADLFAIDELEDLATPLRVRLKGFAPRIRRAVSDLPNGDRFMAFVDAIGALEPARVPESMRVMLADEATNPKRGPTEKARIAELSAEWADAPAEPFEMGATRKVTQLPTAGRPTGQGMRVKGGAGLQVKRTRSSGKASKPPRPPRPSEDPNRQAWIRQVCRERLAGAAHRGLLEAVLVAGTKHRGRDRYPDMTPKEVTDVLKSMVEAGEARVSAGRWTIKLGRR